MPRYADDAKDKVRDASDLVTLVAARTGDLRRTGGENFMGICPFHDERTPSFSVNAGKKLFHCFGCGESGDVFDFVMKTENVDFLGSLEFLADRAGITLEVEEEDPQAAAKRAHRDRLFELLERTAAYYVRQLWESREAERARQYLLGRGLEEATLREFRVGWAPSQWDTVFKGSSAAGFKSRELFDAGLTRRGKDNGRLYDFFRSRIMFPLADGRGRVRGFSGRVLEDNKMAGGKYVNSPDGDLFHKRELVYAADLARAAAAKAGQVLLCEGYTDVLALHQAGLRNAVATMGTALTEEQVVSLGRMAPTIVLALDSDNAGQEAMVKAAKVAGARKVDLRVARLPEGRDPADVYAAEGADAVKALVADSVPYAAFRVDRAISTGNRGSADGKDAIIADLQPVFATLGPSVLQDELLRIVADRLDIAPDLARSLLYKARRGGGRPAPPPRRAAPSGPDGGYDDVLPPDDGFAHVDEGGGAPVPPRRAPVTRVAVRERSFLTFCLGLPDAGTKALSNLDLEASFTDDATRRAAAWLHDHLGAPLDGLPADDPELEALVTELVARAGSQSVTPASLEAESLQLELARLDRQIASASSGKADLAKRREELRRRIDDAVDRALA